MPGLKEKLQKIDLKGLKDKLAGMILGRSDVLGVDIGTYSVKLAAVGAEKGRLLLKHWAHLPLDTKSDASPEERTQQIVGAIRAALLQKGVILKNAATSVSGNSVIVRYVKFPLLTKSELKSTLVAEAEPFIPFDINDVQLGFHILGETEAEGQRRMETVLVAVKKEAIQARVEILDGAGLKPAIIDVDSFALENVHERLAGPEGEPGATLYLNIGHTVTNLSIIEGGATRVVRDVFIAGGTLTKAVMKALQYDFAKAEEVKNAHGLLLDAEEKEQALQEGNRDALGVSQSISAALKDLVAELHRSVDFYLSQGPERSIGRIVISGGTARMRNLVKFLSGELKVPVAVLDPFAFLAEPPADLPEDLKPAMGVAMGLALRRNRDWV